MVNWLDRGFVQDSDEDEDLDIGLDPTPPQQLPPQTRIGRTSNSQAESSPNGPRIDVSTPRTALSRVQSPSAQHAGSTHTSEAGRAQGAAKDKKGLKGGLEDDDESRDELAPGSPDSLPKSRPLATAKTVHTPAGQRPRADQKHAPAESVDIYDIPSSDSSQDGAHSSSSIRAPTVAAPSTPVTEPRDNTPTNAAKAKTALMSAREPVVVINIPLLTQSESKVSRSEALQPLPRETSETRPAPDTPHALDLDSPNGIPSAARRNFRTRNPIQLHPYQFDRQQYHMTLYGTGYRPIHVADKSQRPQRSRSASVVSGNASDSTAFSMGSDLPPASDPLDAITSGQMDVDFPDMNPSERRVRQGESRVGHKKQKTAHHTSTPRSPVRTLASLTPFSSDDDDVAAALAAVRDQTKKAQANARAAKPGLRMPCKLAVEPHLQANGQSPGKTFGNELSDDEEGSDVNVVASGRRNVARPRSVATSPERVIRVDSSRSSGSEADTEEEQPSRPPQHVQAMRKRIKGVLPASWLRLDQQAQGKEQHESHPKHRSFHDHATPARGVAKRIYKPVHTTPGVIRSFGRPTSTIEIPDDSESTSPLPSSPERSPSNANHSTRRAAQRRLENLFDSFDGDVVEEDFVDPMIPTPSRPRPLTTSKPKKQKQSRLTGSRHNFTRESKGGASTRPRHLANGGSTRPRTRLKQQSFGTAPRYSRRSILDSAGHAKPVDEPLPDFVRLAMRHARQRTDRGRHSPSKKLIAWYSREDALDMDNELQQWKLGNVKRSKRYPAKPKSTSQKRKPLQESQANQLRQLPLAQAQQSPSKRHVDGDALVVGSPGNQETRTGQGAVIKPQRGGSLTQARRLQVKKSKPRYMELAYPHARPGNLEGLRAVREPDQSRNSFLSRLSALNHALQGSSNDRNGQSSALLGRFLYDDDIQATEEHFDMHATSLETTRLSDDTRDVSKAVERRRKLKKKPIRLLVDDDGNEGLTVLSSFADVPLDVSMSSPTEATPSANVAFQGLGPFGSAYTTDFGVSHFPQSICFHQTTFIGSGNFKAACTFADRDLDISAGHITLSLHGQAMHLGPWSEEAYSSLCALHRESTRILDSLPNAGNIQAGRDAVLLSTAFQKVSQWLTHHLSFLDPIDRQEFVARFHDLLVDLVFILPMESSETDLSILGFHVMIWTFQCFKIAQSDSNLQSQSMRLLEVFTRVARWTMRQIVTKRACRLRGFHDRLHLRQVCETGIKDEGCIEALVGLFHLTDMLPLQEAQAWSWLDEALATLVPEHCNNVDKMETVWHTLFATLPFYQFDLAGLYDRDRRVFFHDINLASVNKLVFGALTTYKTAPNATQANSYLRSLLARSFRIVKQCNWTRCDSLLKKVFDFFAQRGFSMLEGEDVGGSFEFLRHLTVHSNPSLLNSDKSFHIFLKMMVMAMRQLREVPDKKARGVTFRFIPNHGRAHAKDQTLLQKDLAAIRNQHDLLAVLHCASPPAARPRLSVVQGLVDFRSSHSEICRLQIRTWANITNFQLSTNESEQSVANLASWYSDMLQQLVLQHSGARTETESYRQKHPAMFLTKESIEKTIDSNQRQVEALISMALGLLCNLVKKGEKHVLVKRLFQAVSLEPVFELFEAGFSRLSTTLCEVLNVYRAYANRKISLHSKEPSQSSTTESQDYGDFPNLDDFDDPMVLDEPRHDADGDQEAAAFRPLHSFLSNCIGLEQPVDDALLETLVGTWVSFAHSEVVDQRRNWDYFLDGHSPGAWSQLRQTAATNRLYPLYLSLLVDSDPKALQVGASTIVQAWLVSLMERESLLKYQHRLTNSLLNASTLGRLPLLANLPFARDRNCHKYAICLQDIRARRIQLLSSVFENMQSSWHGRAPASDAELESHVDLKLLLRHVMNAMRANYEATSQDSPTRGAYVDFVQRVVELLQQYASDILQVDKYFTDSAAFPLPSDDPTYVVGKLKSHFPKLAEARTQKQLRAFIQNSVERAVVEGQQSYLVDQVTRALDSQREDVSRTTPTLRQVLLMGCFPSYIRAAFENDCGWILAQPILVVMKRELEQAMFQCELASADTMRTMTSIVSHFAITAASCVNVALQQPGLVEAASIVHTLRHVLEAAQPLPSMADYLHSLSRGQEPCVRHVAYLRQQVEHLGALLARLEELVETDIPLMDMPKHDFVDLETACAKDLRDTLGKEWKREGDKYVVVRGRGFREVPVRVEPLGEELAQLVRASDAFVRAYDCAVALPVVGHGMSMCQQQRHRLQGWMDEAEHDMVV